VSAKEQAKITKSLARISVQCNLDGDELVKCIREAWDLGKSRCGDLTITCREKTKDAAIFLFEAEQVLYQFPIPFEVLRPPPKQRSTWEPYCQDF